MQLIVYIPVIFWLVFRVSRPVILLKELKEGIHSDPQNVLFFMIAECFAYCVASYVLYPFIDLNNTIVRIDLIVVWIVSLFLAVWMLWHVFKILYIFKRN